MNSRNGFTVVELITILMIIGITTTMFIFYINPRHSGLRDTAMSLRTDILNAKSEAIKRNRSITVNAAGSSYNATAAAAGDIFQKHLDPQYSFNSTAQVIISPIGTAFNGAFYILDADGHWYKIEVNRAAKVTVEKGS